MEAVSIRGVDRDAGRIGRDWMVFGRARQEEDAGWPSCGIDADISADSYRWTDSGRGDENMGDLLRRRGRPSDSLLGHDCEKDQPQPRRSVSFKQSGTETISRR